MVSCSLILTPIPNLSEAGVNTGETSILENPKSERNIPDYELPPRGEDLLTILWNIAGTDRNYALLSSVRTITWHMHKGAGRNRKPHAV